MFLDSSLDNLRDELEGSCILSHHVVTEGDAVACVYAEGAKGTGERNGGRRDAF